MPRVDPGGRSLDYIRRREAMRKMADPKYRAEVVREEMRSRAEAERQIRSIVDEELKKKNTEAPGGSRWWRFWKRSKQTTEGWE